MKNNNVLEFLSAVQLQEKKAAEGRIIEDEAIEALDDAFSNLVDALMSTGEYREYPIDPWLLLDCYAGLLHSIDRDARDNPQWLLLREICDFITATGDTQS